MKQLESRAQQAQMTEAQDQMEKLRSQFLSMMLQTTMMIAQVHTPDNYHCNESESTNSKSYSAQTTSSYTKHNTRSSRNKDECKKATFENTTPMFLVNVTTPANSHSNESASIKSASYSANHATNTESCKANKYKNTTFENPTTNAELLVLHPTKNLTVPRPSQLMTKSPKNLADQEEENDHKLVWTGTTGPPPKKYRNPRKSTPAVKPARSCC